MTEMVEYIASNYTWFLGAGIIIVLAVIGYYADKTNFGQGKSKVDNSDNKLDKIETQSLEGKRLSELTKPDDIENINAQEIFEENSLEDIPEDDFDFDMFGEKAFRQEVNNGNVANNSNGNIKSTNSFKQNNMSSNNNALGDIFGIDEYSQDDIQQDNDISLGNSNPKVTFDDFDEAFNTVVPKEDFIDNELLEDIDDLSLEKTKKFNFDDIPDLDDVDLPEIRETKISDNDIWKF